MSVNPYVQRKIIGTPAYRVPINVAYPITIYRHDILTKKTEFTILYYMMNANTRKIFDDAKAKAVHRFGTSNLYFLESPIYGGWKLEIRLAIMADADRIFDMDYGEIRVWNNGTVTLSHRKGWVFDTDDELFDIMAERFVRMIRDYKDYVKIETERLLEEL